MRIAVPYENGNIFQHFGRSEAFKFYDVDGGAVTAAAVVSTNGSGHGALAGFLFHLKHNKDSHQRDNHTGNGYRLIIPFDFRTVFLFRFCRLRRNNRTAVRTHIQTICYISLTLWTNFHIPLHSAGIF